MKNTQKQIVEIRSNVNNNVVAQFEHIDDGSTNIITAGYQKVCAMFGIDRINAENRYYVTKN